MAGLEGGAGGLDVWQAHSRAAGSNMWQVLAQYQKIQDQ